MENATQLLLLANLVLTAFLTGLIWFVQVVHYPIFLKVKEADFALFHKAHTTTTSYVVVAPMLLELGLSGWMLLYSFPGFPAWLPWLAFGLVLAVWLVTFQVSVPLHNQLEREYSKAAITRLVNTNWLRTFLWTSRLALLVWMLASLLG
jgi:hypothetical protein